MTSATVAATSTTLTYDPLMRLYQTASGSTTSRFAYDGLDAIAEYNASGNLQRRWVFDPTTGQPVVWYEGIGTGSSSRRYLSANELGSVISVSDSNGIGLAINKYDEFGIPNLGALANQRFGYTGQAWLPSAGLWYYKARIYHPILGRFLQPDPIGYWDSPNPYAYVLNDPVNFVDPLGLQACDDENVDAAYDGSGGDGGCGDEEADGEDIVVTGKRIVSTVTVTAQYGVNVAHYGYFGIPKYVLKTVTRTTSGKKPPKLPKPPKVPQYDAKALDTKWSEIELYARAEANRRLDASREAHQRFWGWVGRVLKSFEGAD